MLSVSNKKPSLILLQAILTSLTLILSLFFTNGASYANEGVQQLSALKTVAHNNINLALGADKNIYMETPEKTWRAVYTAFNRNGVSDLQQINGRFYATGFFEGAVSSDGVNWTRFTLPLGEKFNPGKILPDEKVFTNNIMSVQNIQNFLNNQNTQCRSGYVCLKDYRETTYDRAANAMCKEYKGKENETAAEIIHKSAVACGVSAEVLIVMLQKEQSLITHTFPSQSRYNIAMGYACPDTAPCNTLYYGFYNQVYNAARQLVRYTNPPGTSNYFNWFPVQKTSTVRWHPNAACGGSQVFIENKSTASFYYYTPYQPNTAALVAFSGIGDSCSAYGNRNLWRLYNQWFNTKGEYKTHIAGGNNIFMATDMDGTVALSSNGTSWIREATTPVKTGEQVSHLYFKDGQFIIALTNGQGYGSANGKTWASVDSKTIEPAPQPVTVGVPQEEPVTETPTGEETPQSPETPTTTPAPETPTPAPEIQPVAPSTTITHTVVRGDTVWKLASQYKTTVNRIVELNSLPRGGALIFIGQKLTIESNQQPIVAVPSPTPEPTPETTPAPAPETTPAPAPETTPAPAPAPTPTPEPTVETSNIIHTAARGDTVWKLASQYKTTVANIVSINSLPNNGALIFVGQKLTISNSTQTPTTQPQTNTTVTTHTVKPRETLYSIAKQYGTTIKWLADNNKIRNINLIRPGMILTVR
jgi:LysM repeat protein